jgi:hypothetical protein
VLFTAVFLTGATFFAFGGAAFVATFLEASLAEADFDAAFFGAGCLTGAAT